MVMDQELSIEAKRFKMIRESLGFTQQAFAEVLSINNSTADIERGKTKPSGKVVTLLFKEFKVNPLWLFGYSNQRFLDTSQHVAPKVVTVTHEGNENVVLVNIKAAAGYPHNLQDVEWYRQLPAFDVPLPEFRNATFRGFQVEGDSMLPSLTPNEWVIGRSLHTFSDIDNNRICVLVLKDSVLVKKVQKLEDPSKLMLISLNELYPPVVIEASEIQEIWLVMSKLSFEIDTQPSPTSALSQLRDSVETLKREIKQLQK